MTKIILIHGGGGPCDGNTHWFPYLDASLSADTVQVLHPDFPDPENMNFNIWVNKLESLKPDKNTILVGHSYGAVLAMRWAMEHKVKGLVIVAEFYTSLGDEEVEQSEFLPKTWNWESIQANTSWIEQFHSQDDPYIQLSEAKLLSKNLDTNLHIFQDAMHFGIDRINPYKEFPELLNLLKNKI